jgi:KaiC/GvpD/RAD55 family RecA-like ATPase
MCKENRLYLSTGIKQFDALLSPDYESKTDSGGFLIGDGKERTDYETPAIVIEGTTGTGKTTLALQIAHAAARNNKWVTFYFSIEQSIQSLKKVSKNFGYFPEEKDEQGKKVEFNEDNYIVLSEFKNELKFDSEEKKLYFGNFSPRPFSQVGDGDVFEQRLSELNHILKTVSSDVDNSSNIIFIIDGVSAFSSSLLNRNEIYRLFSTFRNHHIPCIFTLERFSDIISELEEVFFENTKFIADIVISLAKDDKTGYLQYYLEIIKSRIGRQALGKHLYKIRTQRNASSIGTDSRMGIVVYPSIHYVLSLVREKKEKSKVNEREFMIDDQKKDDLGLILNNFTIKHNSSIAIVGPNGTHKLALGINLAFGQRDDEKNPNVLIINFGGSTDIKFGGVAWTKFNSKYRKIKKISKKPGSKVKFWHTPYGIEDEQIATVTSFKIGQVTPEECFEVIESIIVDAEENNNPFTSVVLNNTAEISTGFPLLVKEPLFLPALIDLFVVQQLVSIWIGVEGETFPNILELNFTLLANADYRIVLSHYPNIEIFSRQFVNATIRNDDPELKEQLISLIIDNVTGKHYKRKPRWLYVDEKESEKKRLHCLKKPKFDK